MTAWNQRTELLLGRDATARLANSRVLVVGIGGVGAYAAEMITRAGIGNLTLIDGDIVGESNLNRQLPALRTTIGLPKTSVMAGRLLSVNPDLQLCARQEFITPESIPGILEEPFDFVVDAIDSVAPKVALIECCLAFGIPIISSMGAGGRTDPSKIRYADLWETRNDGLAKAVRSRLKARGIRQKLPVVWSEEPPAREAVILTDEIAGKRSSYGTVSYLPAIFGCMLGAYVIRKLTGK